jgi:hypothetical protein
MTEEDLQLLITLDDPVDAPEEDTFNHHAKNALEYWLGQRFPAGCRLEQVQAASDEAGKVTFSQGDWTCTLYRLTGTTSVSAEGGNVIEQPNKRFDIEVCTITQRKNGEIIEQKVFYDLVGIDS